MLYPKGSYKDIILFVGGFYNAFAFHMSYFSIYLPLKPRNNKTMMKSVSIGTLITSLVYLSYGILFYLMYGSQVSDSALKLDFNDDMSEVVLLYVSLSFCLMLLFLL